MKHLQAFANNQGKISKHLLYYIANLRFLLLKMHLKMLPCWFASHVVENQCTCTASNSESHPNTCSMWICETILAASCFGYMA